MLILPGGHFVGDRHEAEDARHDGPAAEQQRRSVHLPVQERRGRRPGLQPLPLHGLDQRETRQPHEAGAPGDDEL